MKLPASDPLSREQIWEMFDGISPTYDRTNRIITLGLDQLWRKKMGTLLPNIREQRILDCATGTGDQIIALLSKRPHLIDTVIGVDLAQEMLKIARDRLQLPYRSSGDVC